VSVVLLDAAQTAVVAQYAMQVPLLAVYSLRKFVPSLGLSFLIVTARDGITFAPLYFHEGYRSLHDVIQALGSFVAVTKHVSLRAHTPCLSLSISLSHSLKHTYTYTLFAHRRTHIRMHSIHA
jgi:hypothetical protein